MKSVAGEISSLSVKEESRCEVVHMLTQLSIEKGKLFADGNVTCSGKNERKHEIGSKIKQAFIKKSDKKTSTMDSYVWSVKMAKAGVKMRSQSYYCKELNELFEDFHHVPHRCRDDIDKLSQAAAEDFPDNIWVLHSAGWGFHLIGNEKKSAELLLKGLKKCLCHFPEIQSYIPNTIHGNVDEWLDKIKIHPHIKPYSSVGLNVAAYLSSLAYVYRNRDKSDEGMRSLANRLNPYRNFQKNSRAELANDTKLKLISPEQDLLIRRSMVRE